MKANADMMVVLNRFAAVKFITDESKPKLPGLKTFEEVRQFEEKLFADEELKNAFVSLNGIVVVRMLKVHICLYQCLCFLFRI